MKIQISTELQTARHKMILAQQKVDHLYKAGKNRRNEETKYWLEQVVIWTRYATQLNDLTEFDSVEITKTVMSSGEFHIAATYNGKHIKFLSKRNIPQEVFDRLSIGADYSTNNPPCAVCGAIGTELHHFAPKELFPQMFELWPKSYLCDTCHKEWHNKITIPLRKYRNRERKNNE